jgi:flavin reductase (DIM6/NTAB) family NADH-FMN oxidoreductase RutF
MKKYTKRDFPVGQVRRFLEPSPTVLVTSRYKDETNIMTMNWYTILEFLPSLIGCMITGSNHSFDLIRKSKECVINIPTTELKLHVVGIGNSTGEELDKFETFKLTPQKASKVGAPLIKECYANFECRLVDAKLVNTYNFFIFEIVKAHVATAPKYPETIHYRGDGVFMVSGKNIHLPTKV